MNSSISNSEQMSTQRRIFLRIILTILIGMGVAMGIVRGFTEVMSVNAQVPISWTLGRVLEGQEGLKRLLVEDEGDLVMVYGSSMIDAGFGPREFDQHIADAGGQSSSWNYGFGNLNPLFQELLARRIVDDFKASDRRLKLLLIEFNPFQTTKTRRNRAVAIEEPYISLMASREEIVDRILDNPASGLRIAEIRYLRDGFSAEAITTYFLSGPFTQPRADLDPGLEEDEAAKDRLDEVRDLYRLMFKEEFAEFAECNWCYDWKGGNVLPSERSEELTALLSEYYSLKQSDYKMAIDRLSRIRTADIEELDFDEDLVVAFIEMVKVLAQVSDNIEVIMLPQNNDWITNPPEALQRLNTVIARIENETGVTVRNFQKIDAVTNDMFSDTTHLTALAGRDAFTRFLAEEYGHFLRD